MVNIILTYFDIRSFRTYSPSLKETTNEKVLGIDTKVQVHTGKKKVTDQKSPYKANTFHSYEEKLLGILCQRFFFPLVTTLSPSTFYHPIVSFKTPVSEVEVFEAS